MPRVSVVMALYNRADLVQQSIRSILDQTFTDFEFIIVDDGSTDGSREVVKAIQDPRIKLIEQPENRGIGASVNVGIQASHGEYIARMDSDDLCDPLRLMTQVSYLDGSPKYGACCSYAKGFGVPNAGVWKPYILPEEIKADLLFRNRIAQPTVMMRRSVLDEHGLTYNEKAASEDYDLWWRLCRVTSMACIPVHLASIRRHEQRNVITSASSVRSDADRIREEQMAAIGLVGDYAFHHRVAQSKNIRASELMHAHAWLEEIEIHNDHVKYFESMALRRVLCDRWLDLCASCVDRIHHPIRLFRSSPYGTFTNGMSKDTLLSWIRLLRRAYRGSRN